MLQPLEKAFPWLCYCPVRSHSGNTGPTWRPVLLFDPEQDKPDASCTGCTARLGRETESSKQWETSNEITTNGQSALWKEKGRRARKRGVAEPKRQGWWGKSSTRRRHTLPLWARQRQGKTQETSQNFYAEWVLEEQHARMHLKVGRRE